MATAFKMSMVDGFVQARRVDAAGKFQATIDIILDAAGDDLEGKPLNKQVTKVAALFNQSQPPLPALRLWYGIDDYPAEIARRAAKTESERFIPLLRRAWDRGLDAGFFQLKKAFGTCNGEDLVRVATVLATHAKLPTPLVSATCSALDHYLTSFILAEIDTPSLRSADNDKKCAALGRAIGRSLQHEQGKGNKGEDTDADARLRTSKVYTELLTTLEAEDKSPPDFAVVLKAMASTAVGRVYLVSGKAAAPIFAKFAAGRTDAEYAKAFNAVVAVDAAGKSLMAECITPKVCTNMIHGRFGKSNVRLWYDLCRPIIAKRDGLHAAERMDSDLDVWITPIRLAECQPILERAFGFIGYSGKHKGDFKSFMAAMVAHSKQVDNLPDALMNKKGLQRSLCQIGNDAIEFTASRDQTMLRDAPAQAVLPSPFLAPDSHADQQLGRFEKDLEEAVAKVRMRDEYGQGFEEDDFWRNKRQREPGSPWQWSPGMRTGAARWSQPLPPRINGWQMQGWQQPGQGDDEGYDADLGSPTKKPRGEAGAMLKKWGAWLTPDGIVFGAKFLVNAKPNGFPQGSEKGCLGNLAYNRSAWVRNEWCNMGCTGHSHARPNGIQEDSVTVIDIQNTASLSDGDKAIAERVRAAKNSWIHLAGNPDKNAIMGTVAKQGGPGKGGGAGSSGNAGGASWKGNDASGKGGRKGKGKGGKGKGGKGNGGKGGKGGKGDGPPSNFARQYRQ